MIVWVEVLEKPTTINYTSKTGQPARRVTQKAALWHPGEQHPDKFTLSIDEENGQEPYALGLYHVDGACIQPRQGGKDVNSYQVGLPSIGRTISLTPLKQYVADLTELLSKQGPVQSIKAA